MPGRTSTTGWCSRSGCEAVLCCAASQRGLDRSGGPAPRARSPRIAREPQGPPQGDEEDDHRHRPHRTPDPPDRAVAEKHGNRGNEPHRQADHLNDPQQPQVAHVQSVGRMPTASPARRAQLLKRNSTTYVTEQPLAPARTSRSRGRGHYTRSTGNHNSLVAVLKSSARSRIATIDGP